jgi:hypothetical protein
MARSGPILRTLDIGGRRRTAVVFVADRRVRGPFWGWFTLGLGAFLVALSAMLDSGELGLLGFLIGVCALLLLFTRWVVKYFPRGGVFFGLLRDGVVIGSLLGRRFVSWSSIDTFRVTQDEGRHDLIDPEPETFLELIGPPDGSPERSLARRFVRRLAVRLAALSASKPRLADALAKSLEAFADGGTVSSPDAGTHGVVKRLSGKRQRTRVRVDGLSAPIEVVVATFRVYWEHPERRIAIGTLGSISVEGEEPSMR